jgi:hypothetical protein
VWTISTEEAVALIRSQADSIEHVVAGATGDEQHPDLAWSVAGYVCHVGDNLRIWAERLMGVVGGASLNVGGYNEMELASARNYESIPLPAALWSLHRAIEDWLSAVGCSPRSGTVVVHSERGAQTLQDVTVSNAHDEFHHRWDIERILHSSGG